MTRIVTPKSLTLRVIAPSFGVLTVLISLIALGQTEGEGPRARQEHDVFGASRVSEFSQFPNHQLPQPGNADWVAANGTALEKPDSDAGPMDSGDPIFLPPITFGSGGFYARVAVGDVNGDGKMDAIAANCAPSGPGPCPSNGVLGVLLGAGDGTFQTVVTYDSGGFGAMAAAVADVNGDGKADVVVANFCVDSNGCPQGPGVVGVLLGNGDGTLKTAVTYASGGYTALSIAVADVNGDAKPDLVVANHCNGTCNTNHGGVGVLLGNGDGTFKTPVPYDAGVGATQQVVVADVNGDSKLDLLVANFSNSTLGVLLGKGDGTFQPVVTYDSGGAFVLSVAVADVNGDGNPDLVASNCAPAGHRTCGFDNKHGVLGVLLGNGDGSFQSAVGYDSGGAYAASVAVADIDGDGNIDLVATNYGNGTVALLLGNGGGSFQPAVTFFPGTYSPYTIQAADMNGDGRPDVVTGGIGAVGVLLNNTGPHSSTSTAVESNANPASPGELVTYTATVTSQYVGTVTGSVTFQDRGKTIANAPLSGNQATYSLSYSKLSTRLITAKYSGDLHSAGSTSSTLNEYIKTLPVATTTIVTTSGSPSLVGQPVTFTATTTSMFGVIPDGESVTFYDGTTAIGTGATASGVATFVTSSLTAKTHTIKAIYSGDPRFKLSSGAVTQIVEKYATTTALHSSLNPSHFGQAVTFTARVKSTGPSTPTGKVKFLDGTLGIGSATLSGGVAKLTKSNLAVGTHPITAQYLGDAVSAKSTSSVVNQVVQ